MYPLEDAREYAEWATARLLAGDDSPSLRVLAGLDEEQNLFVLHDWLRRTATELQIEMHEGKDARISFIAGMAEEALESKRPWRHVTDAAYGLWQSSCDPELKLLARLEEACRWLGEAEFPDLPVRTEADAELVFRREAESWLKGKHG